MCGIAGFTAFKSLRSNEELSAIASRMGKTLAHRGPDDDGVWTDAESGIALAHRRLSIIDLSPEGHQPMFSPSGRYAIVFNGEVYNFRELRQELDKSGFSFRGHSDTEVMLASFEKWGLVEAVKRFNGMFAFALWDKTEQALHLVRDRMGIKPLYFGLLRGEFAFSSELKALKAHPDWQGAVDRNSLAMHMRFNYIPAPHSIYQGVYKLYQGSILSIKKNHS